MARGHCPGRAVSAWMSGLEVPADRCLKLRMCSFGSDLAFEPADIAKLALTNLGGIIYSEEAQTEQKKAREQTDSLRELRHPSLPHQCFRVSRFVAQDLHQHLDLSFGL